MNEKGKIALDTSVRMKKDINFRNTILKNSKRLREKSNDDHINSKAIRESNFDRSAEKIFYKKIEKNKIIDSKINISIDFNSNITKKNNIRKKFFLDLNFDKTEEHSNPDTERTKDNINADEAINKLTIIKVNQNKNIKINLDNKENNIRKDNNQIEFENMRKNTNEVKPFYSRYIKQIFSDTKENQNLSNIKRKAIRKRSNSIRRIMNSLYYNSYSKEQEKSVIEEKPQLIEKINNVGIVKKIDYYKNNNNVPIIKKIIIKNKNSFLTKENNLNIIKIKRRKIENNEESNKSNTFLKKQNNIGKILKMNKDIYTFSTEENSVLTTNQNKEKKIKNQDDPRIIKVKKKYQYKPSKKINTNEKLMNNITSINHTINNIKLLKKTINNNDENKQNKNELQENKNKRNDKIIPIRMKYKQKTKLFIRNREAELINKNMNSDINENVFISNTEPKHIYNDSNISNAQENENIIIQFFDDIIELCNGIKEKTIFEVLIKKINKKYFIDYDKISFEINSLGIRNNFNYCFKYFCIILISFCFLSIEDNLYKTNFEKTHLLFIQFIYSSLNLIDCQNLNSRSIKYFLNEYNLFRKVSITQCTNSIIKLLFGEKKEYISLDNILKQLMKKVPSENIKDIIKIINKTILFCFNKIQYNKRYINSFYNINLYTKYFHNMDENNKKENYPCAPYIKTNMKKSFCLVLDLDETISHSIKINYGNYFFLRPGTIEFLNELSKFYEIIIFTSSPKEYADDILDKIDSSGDLISHRLYKPHVIFEKGKSVKKLELIGRDLNKIIFVDNLKYNAKYNLKNLYLIPSWTDDINDNELYKLGNKLKYIYESGKFNDDITKGL